MASSCKIQSIFFTLTLFLLSFTPQIDSLSSVSISYTSNQTIVCGLIPSYNQQSFINCTSFPTGIQFHFPNVSYNRIVGGNGFLCGLRSQSISSNMSAMECWRFVGNNNILHKRIYKGPSLNEFEAGNSHVCGNVNGSSKINCWLWKERKFYSNTQFFSKITVGDDFVCGLNENGNVFCLGNDTNVVGKEPKNGGFSVIASGLHHVCAISLNGGLNCWGKMVGNHVEGELFKDLAMGDDRICGIRVNDTVVCWGNGDFKIPKKLEGTYFTGIVAKGNVFCGVESNNFSLLCWGNDILDGNQLVFARVMPGHCARQCPCSRPLPGSGDLCGQGMVVCEPCGLMGQLFPPSLVSGPAPSLEPSKSDGDKWTAKMVVLLVVGCFGCLSLVASIVFFLWYRYRDTGGSRVHDSGPIELVVENPLGRRGGDQQTAAPALEKRLSHMYSMGNGGHLEEFPLEVLLKVTDGFSQECRVGIGSFGSVYCGVLDDGREVAIKRAEVSSSNPLAAKRKQEDRDVAFMAELEFLSRLNHKHLVRLLGFYEDANERVLVYEFMSNFTLHDHLHKLKGSSPLASWPNRLQVALDAARGIDYLHAYAVPAIIHRDIKPSNILLDSNWTAKVSDFGLSLMGPPDGESHLSLWAAGTLGYVDPEYYKLHILTTKSDVYSFGVVLLELLSGCKAIHTNEEGMPRNVVEFVLPYIMRGEIHRVLDQNVPPPSPVEIDAVRFIGYLAVDCVSLEGRNRPSMSEVVSCLERALASCLIQPTLSPSSTQSSH
ncbi:serine/threonine-protein kinase-like protein CCR4 [Amaranthus tricolor]|uniref:serine/threonine-protein kinase-like protein CCR4 n=1 Tax=Amaranthus tricolor TaxID=29722 RepID=UPI0025889A2A|nr:serine/threonine-protein kinase-like protein CCR4 [Amaranthus tricolor]